MNLVTGATGLLGNNLVRRLLARGRPVRVLARETSDARPLEGLDVEVVRGDVRDEAAVERAVRGAEVVYHAAARVGIGRRAAAAYRDVNVAGAAVVARASRRAGARLVHVSSADAQGWGTVDDPADESAPPGAGADVPYCASKREAESAVHAEVERGLDAVIVRPAYLLGPWDWKPSSGRMLLAVAAGRGRIAPPGGNDFCHAVDVADGCLAAAERGRGGEAYLLGGEGLSYRDAFALFAEITGGAPPRLTAPAALVRAAGRAASAVGRLARREPDFNACSADLACLPHHVDDARARRELGYRPRSARAAAEDAWRWFVDRGYAGSA